MPSPEELLALEPELRVLAQELLSDPLEAEDALQETYLEALDGRPDEDRNASGWLRRILRSKARQVRRRAHRMRHLELGLPAGLADPDSEERERHKRAFLRQLAEELERLREPYRATLRARFLAGVPPRELARREGVPVRTIHTRITRGLALLREALERRVGRPSWSLLAWTFGRGRRAVALGAAALAVLLGAAYFLRVDARRSMVEVHVAEASAPSVRLLSVDSPAERTLDPAAIPGGPGPIDGQPSAPSGTLGRVVDLAGLAVAGLEVFFEPGTIDPGPLRRLDYRFVPTGPPHEGVTSAQDGSFRLRVPRGVHGRVLARGRGFCTVRAELFYGFEDPSPLEVVVTPRVVVRGHVLTREGTPVADARLVLRLPESFLIAEESRSFSWLPAVSEARSAPDGAFRLDEVCGMDALRLEVHAEGFEAQELRLDASGVPELECEARLVPSATPADRLRGSLCSAGGAPVVGCVAAHGSIVETDADGHFELAREGLESGAEVWGFQRGHLPARWSYDPAVTELVLTVGGPAARIRGRVEDEHGRPVAGAFVWSLDPTPLGTGVAGFFAETHMNEDPGAEVPFQVDCDAEGRFELPYLLPRAYVLGALDRESFLASRSEPIEAGSEDVVLRIVRSAPRSPVLGRVLDRDGVPLPGATVAVLRNKVQVKDEEGRTLTTFFRGPVELADEDGWFGLPEVPEDGCTLDVMVEGCFPAMLPIPIGSARDYVEVAVARRTVLEVLWSAREEPLTHFVVLDEKGGRLDVLPASDLDTNQAVIPRVRMPIERGRPAVLAVPDRAVALVFFADEREVLRRTLEGTGRAPRRIEL